MAAAVEAAAKGDAIVTLGIKPTWPCPGYGYIERGARARISGVEGGHPVHEVVRFREKPDTDLAERFLADGHFSWNAGIFVWSIATVMRELARHCPELADFVTELRHSRDFDATVAAQFPKLTRISVDYALMEKATRVFNIEADIGWDDVGGWVSVGKYLEQAGRDNATRGPVTLLDSYNNVVYSSGGARVALLGVHDLVVVQTSDAVLVADKDEADRIKKLVEDLPPELC